MVIYESNGRVIDSKEVYIHDDILQDLQFNYFEKKLFLSILKKGIAGNKFTIEFIDVIGFEMSSCDFWGRSPHILDFEYVEQSNRQIIPKLFDKKEINQDSCFLNEKENYIESVITFASGDQLIVACKSIVL